MTTNQKLQYHFGDKPVVWVPAWGISKTRSRGGRYAGAITGEGLWYDQWHDRVLSRETAAKLADLGVNLMILPFSVGGSSTMENQERDDFERMTSYLHECDMVSLPYLQFQNVLQEEFELPDVVWAERLDGTRAQYTYWRRTACQSSPAFRQYFKGLIADAIQRGGDGIWIDNNYLKPCRCPLCVANFRAYLDQNRRDILETTYLTSFDHVEMPPSVEATDDPIVQALIEFNCRRNLELNAELKAHLEQLSPHGLLASNPGLYRGTSLSARGLDLLPFATLYDILYLENHLVPHITGESVVGNYHGFIALRECDTLSIPGCWNTGANPDETGGHSERGLVETEDQVQRAVFEAAAFNACIGMVWPIRSRDHGDCEAPDELLQMYFERPAIHEGMRKALAFVHAIPAPQDRTNRAEVGVLYHRESLMFDGEKSASSLHCAEELLLKSRLPYTAIFSEELQKKAAGLKLILLPDVTLLSDAEADVLRDYVRNGGRILAIGPVGSRNEKKKIRMDLAISDLLGGGLFARGRDVIYNAYGEGKTAYVPHSVLTSTAVPAMFGDSVLKITNWAHAPDIVTNALDTLVGDDRQINVSAEGHIAVTLAETPDGGCLVQLFSYDRKPVEQKVSISLREDLATGAPAEWRTPGNEPMRLTPRQEGSRWQLDVPHFSMFGVLTCPA